MSREIDPHNMTADDVEYVKQRPSLRREFVLQGFGDPLDPEYPGLVDAEPSETDEEREAREERERAEAEAEEAERVAREAREAEEAAAAAAAEEEAEELRKQEQAEAEKAAADTGDPGFEELDESKQWNKSMKKSELQSVINARNADYEDDEQIKPEGDTKDDLIAALEQDDRELAGE